MADDSRKDRESGDGGGLEPDDVIGRVVPDPSKPDVQRLTGLFLGNSSRAGYWRLYLSTSLDHYLEFRKEDTLGGERLAGGQIVVWVKPGTAVQVTKSNSVPVEMLHGTIQQRFISRAVGIGLRPSIFLDAGPGCTVGPECGGTPACQSYVNTCNCGA